MDTETVINISYGIILIATAVLIAYEMMLYIEMHKKSEFSGKLLTVIILSFLLLVIELAFGVAHFIL